MISDAYPNTVCGALERHTYTHPGGYKCSTCTKPNPEQTKRNKYIYKMMKQAALLLISLTVVSAYCPNGCSGHGSCSASPKDTCVCYQRRESRALLSTISERETDLVDAWTGADCSLRTCPKGYAWAASPIADNSHKQLVECSGKGT